MIKNILVKNSFTFLFYSTKVFFLALFLTGFITYAQVGIGTTTPDASSIFEMKSEQQGLLIPRMTTLEREAILNPANSLLVYDSDLNSYFYYDAIVASSWIRISSDKQARDKHVLVKSEADFPPAVGGVITLDTGTLYEINGTINLSAPINLNDAYIAGLDTNEDILSSSGTVFSGTSGGSIRNITITGGGTAFNITGGGSLIIQSTIITGIASVGTVSNLGLYFGNIIQYLNNSNGITYSDIRNLLLSNQGWFSDNSGTFETFTGTFDLIEKVSGFSTVSGAAVGMDFSNNPSVANGVILSVVFSGETTAPSGYVKGYTGPGTYTEYNFTSKWTVDCPGIPHESDGVATGDINLSTAVGSGASTVFAGSGETATQKLSGTTTSQDLLRFEKEGNNKIIYTGEKTRYFQVAASISFQSNGTNPTFIFYVAKNGTIVADSKVYGRGPSGFFSSGGILAVPLIATVSCAKDDYIEVYAKRLSGGGNVETIALNLIVR